MFSLEGPSSAMLRPAAKSHFSPRNQRVRAADPREMREGGPLYAREAPGSLDRPTRR